MFRDIDSRLHIGAGFSEPPPKKSQKFMERVFLVLSPILSPSTIASHQSHPFIKMSVPPQPASGPISISSGGDTVSPTQIVISSDSSSPGRPSDDFVPSVASRMRSITDRSVFLGTPALSSPLVPEPPVVGSRIPASISRTTNRPRLSLASHSRISHSVASPRYQEFDIGLELTELRQQCDALQTENGELKGQIEALK